jgi:hypothetical protein
MCMDFTDLNKCCSKDDFPLVRIDQIIDSAAADEDINTSATIIPSVEILGPIT